MFFKKRKSRKQLLKEIEELQATKYKYFEWWKDKCDALNSVTKQIKTINVSCIKSRNYDDTKNQAIIEECLCRQLAKELLPYVSIEKYVYAACDPLFNGEAKYVATIKVVER